MARENNGPTAAEIDGLRRRLEASFNRLKAKSGFPSFFYNMQKKKLVKATIDKIIHQAVKIPAVFNDLNNRYASFSERELDIARKFLYEDQKQDEQYINDRQYRDKIAEEISLSLMLRVSPSYREWKVEKHFEDRIIAKESDFKPYAGKTGTTFGYVAQRNSDKELFMMKHAKKNPNMGHQGFDYRNQASYEVAAINEFVSAPLYKRILYDRAPIVEAVIAKNPEFMTIRSKFLHNFQTVAEYTQDPKSRKRGVIGIYRSLEYVQGAEKLFSAMLFAGEKDIHADNFGVMKLEYKYPSGHPLAGENVMVYCKIDHGWSGMMLFSGADKMMEAFANMFTSAMGFQFHGKISINLSKFRQAVDEIAKISDAEIEDMIASRIDKLKALGMDINGLTSYSCTDCTRYDDANKIIEPLYFDNYEKLERYYQKNFIQQRNVMQELGARLEVIERIRGTPAYWEDGQWLTDIRGKDPAVWAVDKGYEVAPQPVAQARSPQDRQALPSAEDRLLKRAASQKSQWRRG